MEINPSIRFLIFWGLSANGNLIPTAHEKKHRTSHDRKSDAFFFYISASIFKDDSSLNFAEEVRQQRRAAAIGHVIEVGDLAAAASARP